jgi:hypothetical protein
LEAAALAPAGRTEEGGNSDNARVHVTRQLY